MYIASLLTNMEWFGLPKRLRQCGKSNPTPESQKLPKKDEYKCCILDEGNFRHVVMESNENVLVEFYNGMVTSLVTFLTESRVMKWSPGSCASLR